MEIMCIFIFIQNKTKNNRLYIGRRLGDTSYPLVFWLVGSFSSGIVASHSFHCCI